MPTSTDGGRVTWRDVSEKLDEHARERHDMELRLTAKIDDLRKCMPSVEAVKRNADDIKDLDKRMDDLTKSDRNWNVLNSVGVIIAGVLAGLGIKS